MSRQRVRRFLVVAALVLAVTSCTSRDEEEAASAPIELRLMTFNIEYGGESVDFDSVAAAIEAADADVVGIQEGYAKMPDIAADLGWEYYDARTQVVSRYPLLTPPDPESSAVYVEMEPSRVAAIVNIHLSSSGYGPNRVAAGATKAELLEIEERQRLDEIEPIVAEAKDLIDQGIPTFVMGDFNAPSHLDWTEETIGLRDHVRYAFDWPTGVAAEKAGLVDTYRVIHPDPVVDEGLTWPANRPFVKGYNPGPAGRPADRIDAILAGGDVTTTDVQMVGEKGSDYADVVVAPWPTDHRAVVGTYEVVPGRTPTLISIDQRLGAIGDSRLISYSSSAGDAGSISILPSGGDLNDALAVEDVSNDRAGTWMLTTDDLAPARYDVVLTSTAGEELAQTAVSLVEAGTPASLSTDRRSYSVGEPIEVMWENAPGNKWDWLGVYRQGANPNVAWYKNWAYTEATVVGRATIGRQSQGGPWPLLPGSYSVYLLADDSYEKLAGTDFTVKRSD